MKQETAPLERINNWIKNSIILKLTTIGILILLLLIPATLIKSIIKERKGLNHVTTVEVSRQWANQQQLAGPILTIPLLYETIADDKPVHIQKSFHVLPSALHIQGQLDPERLHKGIYEVAVYTSDLAFSGRFEIPAIPDEANLKEIQYDRAYLTIGIPDLRGVEEKVLVDWNGNTLEAKPGTKEQHSLAAGLHVPLPILDPEAGNEYPFSFELHLQGSKNLSFVPIGNTTTVQLNSDWTAPSFKGNFLPDHREVNEDGFEATWNILQLNRNLPQSWIDENLGRQMDTTAFGVDMIIPLDDYQKSMRSAKYGVMTISLTFLIFFLVEIISKRKIHPFQYSLVGFALCLFYVLLVSISEHLDFNLAYAISTFGIVLMISLYSISVFKVRKYAGLLFVALIGIYGFLFVTLQLVDFALLMGSLGLALILAATMYLTRKIDWYHVNIETE